MRTLLLVLLLALAPPAWAQSGTGQVEVTADVFTVDEGTRQATFTGNVVVTQTGLEMRAGLVVVHYGAGGAGDIESLEASRGVRLVTQGQTATSDRAVYDPDTRVLRLTGNVVVDNAQGRVSGPDLVVNLRDQTSQFSGGGSGGRVTGVFTP
jgi:lipopolysaccharide export system protein LptA